MRQTGPTEKAGMNERTIKGKVAVAGIGETRYYKRGQSPDPEFKLCIQAIRAAADDAGLDVREIDGIASYSDDRNAANRVAAALGLPKLGFANMVWGGGGGGGSAAIGNAAAAIAAGYADVVVVYRALAQGQFGRFGQGMLGTPEVSGYAAYNVPYGLITPAQLYAMKIRRFMFEHGVTQSALKAVSLTSYFHAQQNPDAIMHGRPLTPEKYDESRWIVEPFHLYDCCMENDGAAAVILTSAERARDLPQPPAYLMAAAQGSGPREGEWTVHNEPDYAGSDFRTLSPRIWQTAGIGPEDVDVVQSYENFTGGVVMALAECGFFAPEQADEFLTMENLSAPNGKLPLNTSGGNLAHCYMHGLELVVEAVRQVRGTSWNQVKDVRFSLVNSGPMVAPASTVLFGASAN
jgi:acetyl-CoA acetyltransferase